MKDNVQNKPNKTFGLFRLPLLTYLFCLVVITFLFSGVSLSKFNLSASGASSAVSAHLDVSTYLPGPYHYTITPGQENVYNFRVYGNTSDVTMRYKIEIITDDNIPHIQYRLNYGIEGGGRAIYFPQYVSKVVINNSPIYGELPYGKSITHHYTLFFKLPEGTDAYYRDEVERIRIKITFEQVT